MQYARGAITTQNLAPTGLATIGSELMRPLLSDDGEVAIQITDTGALTPQGSVDQVTWVDLAGSSARLDPGDYTGEIRGIWDTATGFAMATEIV